jgi:hypothetical protein
MERYKYIVLLLSLLGLATVMSSTVQAASLSCGEHAGNNKHTLIPPQDVAMTAVCRPPLSQQTDITEEDKLFCFGVHQGKIQASSDDLLKCKIVQDKIHKALNLKSKPDSFDQALNTIKRLVIIPPTAQNNY